MKKTVYMAALVCLFLVGCGGIPKKAQDDYKRGKKKYQSRDYTGAIGSLNKAVKIYPEYEKAHFLLGESLRITKKYASARKHYEKVIAQNPNHRKALIGLAFCSRKTGHFHEGLGYYHQLQKVVKYEGKPLKKDDSFEVHFGLAQCYLGFGKTEEASEELDKAAKLQGNNPEVYYYKAVAKEREGGQFDQAITQYKKALSVDPNFSLAHRALGYLYFEYYRDDKDWKTKSLNHYKKYIALTKTKDENILTHLKELEGKAPAKVEPSGGPQKPKGSHCPLCGRTYKGSATTCFFDGTPLIK